VISRAQLRELGFSEKAIRHRIERGRLVIEWPGVYRVGPYPLDRDGRFMAAILACGEGAALSHDSAAALWCIRRGGANPIHVSIPKQRTIELEGIRPHRRNPMPETTTIGALPLSRPLFTLVDLAAELETEPLEEAINEADVRATMRRYTRTDSKLERPFLALVRRARLPPPATQERLGPGRIDFHWPALGLVVETDGLTYHRTPMQQLEDRLRDQAHTTAGRTQLRFANVQIRAAPTAVARTLGAVIGRLGRASP
jgi:very-short-patch-repair endonuclease